VATGPIMLPKAKPQRPNKNRYRWIFSENTVLKKRILQQIILSGQKKIPLFQRDLNDFKF
jgi:hypothetical protein